MAINGVEMIIDRTLSDVEIAKSLIKKGLNGMTEEEQKTFLSGLKGAYNYTDFNRVESAVKYLAERLVSIPEEIKYVRENLGVYPDELFEVEYDKKQYENIETKTDWQVFNMLTKADRQRYLQNIILILNSLNLLPNDFPRALEKLTHSGANMIENSLVQLNDSLISLEESKKGFVINTAKAWYYSGDLYGGEI